MEKIKLNLPITILLASIILGGSIFVSQLSKQKSIEKQQEIKIEQDRQVQFSKELQKEDTKAQLDSCLLDAEQNYSNEWNRVCKQRGALTNKCIEVTDMTFAEYLDINKIPHTSLDELDKAVSDFQKQQDDCSCGLPKDNMDILNDYLKNEKNECFKKYPQK